LSPSPPQGISFAPAGPRQNQAWATAENPAAVTQVTSRSEREEDTNDAPRTTRASRIRTRGFEAERYFIRIFSWRKSCVPAAGYENSRRPRMKRTVWIGGVAAIALVCGGWTAAQTSQTSSTSQASSSGTVTVTGCLARADDSTGTTG